MQLHTERSAIQPLAAADLGFIFQKQKADNQLLVNDGETAVIGGLTVTQVDQDPVGHPAPGQPADHRQAVQLHQRHGKPARPHYLGHAPDHRRRRLGSVAASRGPSSTPTGTSPAQAGLVRLPEDGSTGQAPEGTPVHLRFSTAGESHGKALVALVEGLPAGLPVSAD